MNPGSHWGHIEKKHVWLQEKVSDSPGMHPAKEGETYDVP